MDRPVKSRPYRSALRTSRAQGTRRAVLSAAHQRFTAQGYAGTTVAQVAADAGVAVDTVYTSVGRKPQLVLALVDEALAGREPHQPADTPTTSTDRDYVRAMREASTATAKLAVYAAAIATRLERVVPLVAVLRQAANADPEAAAALAGLTQRRADNMRLLAQDLRSTGELRTELSDDDVADLVFATNAPEFYELLTARGRTAQDVQRLLLDLWTRVLVAP